MEKWWDGTQIPPAFCELNSHRMFEKHTTYTHNVLNYTVFQYLFSGVCYIRPKGDHVDVKTIGQDEESGIG